MRRLLCALMLGLLNASALAQGPALAKQQILHKGNGPEAETLDPHKARSVSAANVLRDLYEGLVIEAPDGTLVPGAASAWELSEDGLVYTFHLRPEARWSNGDAVVAEDFVAGLQRSADPATGSTYAQILAPIENAEDVVAGKLPPQQLGVEALEPLRLRIRLKARTPYFLGMLTHASTAPVHRPSLREYGERFARAGTLVGNGAYRLKDWRLQSYILLERNRHYWDDAHTTIEQVWFHTTEDINSEFKRYRAGELDWTEQIPVNQALWIRANLAAEYRVHSYLGTYFYGFNMTRAPFKDAPQLRRALNLAIDRDVIANKVMGAGELRAWSFVPPGVSGHIAQLPEWASWPRERRLAEARRLYAEAGYSAAHPLKVEIRYNTHDDHRRIATAVAAMWKQFLGVEARLLNEEWKTYLQSRRSRITQVYRATWISDYNDASSFLNLLDSRSGLNDPGYANPRYDERLDRAAAEADPVARQALMAQAEAIIGDDTPVIPLYSYVTKRLVRPWVVGWQGNIMDHHRTKDMRILAH